VSKDLLKLGSISHYYSQIGVAVVELIETMKIGDKITVMGSTTLFSQVVESMQIKHEPVKKAHNGDSIGLKISSKARIGDLVFKIIE
jgi:translation elongation factor EF-1alpha